MSYQTQYGADISHWQLEIKDPTAFYEQGNRFIYLKATEGTDFIDLTFVERARMFRNAGLLVGGYHYFHSIDIPGQVALFRKQLEEAACLTDDSLRPMFDVEADDALLNANIHIKEFYDRLDVPAIVYSSGEFFGLYLHPELWTENRDILTCVAFWNGKPGDLEEYSGIPRAALHQHTNCATKHGIPGCVDGDATVKPYTLDMLCIGKNIELPTQPAPTPQPQPDSPVNTYTVVSGDTLSEIGARLGLDWGHIAQINGIDSPYIIYPGQVLRLSGPINVPDKNIYTVVSGDTLSEIGERFNVDWRRIAEVNNISNPNLIYPDQVLIIPVIKKTSSSYIVQSGDTLSEIGMRLGVHWSKLADMNGVTNPNLIYPGQVIHYHE